MLPFRSKQPTAIKIGGSIGIIGVSLGLFLTLIVALQLAIGQ